MMTCDEARYYVVSMQNRQRIQANVEVRIAHDGCSGGCMAGFSLRQPHGQHDRYYASWTNEGFVNHLR
jgi:hypothetical protein